MFSQPNGASGMGLLPARLRPGTIRGWLLLLTAGALLPALLLTIFLLADVHRSARAQAEQQLLATSRALALVVDRQLGQYEALLRALATSPHLASGDFQAFHGQAGMAVPEGTWALLLDREARQLVNTRAAWGVPLPQATAPESAWKELEAGRTHTCNLFAASITGEPVLCVEVPVTIGGENRYDLRLTFTPSTLSRILVEQRLPEGWFGTILDRSDTVVARNRDNAAFVGRKATPDLRASLARQSEGVQESMSLDGTATLVGFSRAPGYGWSFVVAAPREELFAAPRRSLWAGLGASGALLGLGAAVSLLVARRIQRPIRALAGAAVRMGRGETGGVPATGVAELDTLGRVLARSTADLRVRERQLTELNTELEERVRDATARHEQAVEKLHEARKMEAIGQLTGGVAHDFNNLLQAVGGCLSMIGRRTDEPKVKPLLEAGQQAVDRGAKLVQQLMAFARRDSLRPEPIDIRERRSRRSSGSCRRHAAGDLRTDRRSRLASASGPQP